MGRYSSVQAYADTNANMRAVSYDQAAGSAATASAQSGGSSVKTEKVQNPYGSTAGAGSGEFHIYRHARAREQARWKQMDEEETEKALDAEFQEQLEQNRTEEEHKTAKRQKKRERAKEAKKRKRNLKLAGIGMVNESTTKDKVGADDEAEEFTYVSSNNQEQGDEEEKKSSLDDEQQTDTAPKPMPFANDGSFLEMMKKKLAEQAENDNTNDDTEEDERPAKRQEVEKPE